MVNRKILLKLLGITKDFLKLIPLASNLRSKSYSQFWEDRLMARNLKDGLGSYVDVGAGMPTWGSNSYYYYKKGWTGVTIDPIQFNVRMHKLIRPRDKQYRALVAGNDSEINFFQLIPWELSTTNELIANQYISNGAQLISKNSIRTISLEYIYSHNPIKRPALLSIDVEGSEMDVLTSNNWNKFNPDIICVEELNNPLKSSEIREYLLTKDYELIVYNGVSSIYILNYSKYLRKSKRNVDSD
jgi:FkbM family methyltransferase